MMIKICCSFYFRWAIGIVRTQHIKDNFEKLLMNHSKSFDGKGVYKFEIDMMIDFIKIPSLDKNLITANVKSITYNNKYQ